MTISAKPEKTYGLIVGIENYQATNWNVDGPVHDAIKFADWLLSQGVPTDNIKLCLSPLSENSELVNNFEITSKPATEQNLVNIITNDLSQQTGELLFMFWAGHGLITSERNRRLLCADASKNNWQNLDFNSLLLLLGSDSFKIPHHICIVDACANYLLESKGRPTNFGGKQFPSGKPRKNSKQFVLLATREGETAKVNSSEKTGYFSQAVREALAQQDWLPDMPAVAEHVKEQFESLNKQQLPTYFYRRSWDSDIDVYHPNPFEVAHNIPSTQACKFVDRHQPLEELDQLLQDNTIVAITDITGKGGVGKTELAIQYSWYKLEDYPGGCCWLYFKGVNLVTQLSGFAMVKKFSGFKIPENLPLDYQLLYCWENWQPGKVLLVFDNVTDIEQIKDYLPPMGSRFRVLITTRSSQLPYPSLPLGGLPLTASLELLVKLLGKDWVQKQLEFAKQFCQFVGCIPLGLYTIAAHRSDLQEEQSQEEDSGTEVMLELNWDALESSAQTMAGLLSLFALAPIPWSLVSQAARAASLDFDLVVNRDILVQKYLLQKLDDNTYQLHERIREFLSIKGEQLADVETLKQGVCSAIVAIAKDIPDTPTQSDILAITPAIPHLMEVANNHKDYLNDEDLIWPFVGLGRFYHGQGAYEQALPWYQQCLSTVRERLGQEHPSVATSLNNLALLYWSQGRYEEAEPLYLQALDLRKHLLGQERPDVAESLNNLAVLYSNQGRYSEAEPLYLQALDLRKRLLGQDHPDVATTLNNLALLYDSQGRYEEAEPLLVQALDLRKRLLSQEHPYVAESLNNLAGLYKEQGRYQEAEPLLVQALDLKKRLLGIEHPDVAISLNNLGALYESQGRYEEAEPLYLQALDLIKRLLGQENLDVANSLNNLGKLYYRQGRYEEAEPLSQQALELTQRLLGKEHPYVEITLNNLAALYSSQGRYQEAEPLHLQALEMTQRLLGIEHPDVARSLNHLGKLYSNQGRYSEAEPLYQQALQIAVKTLGEEHPTTRIISDNLEDLLGRS